MSQYLSLMVLPPQCAARCTYFTTVLNPRLCENSNPISVIACNFFLVQVSNTVRIQNTRPIPGEYYLHHSVRCDMLDSIPDSGMITVHTTPCTSGPSDRKSGYRPIRCLTVACSYRPPPQPTPEAAKSWWQNNACRQCGSCKRPRDDTLSPTKCNDASDCSTPPTIQRTHRVINEGSSVDKRARVNGTCQEEENMSEQRRLQKRLSEDTSSVTLVVTTCTTTLRHIAEEHNIVTLQKPLNTQYRQLTHVSVGAQHREVRKPTHKIPPSSDKERSMGTVRQR